MYFPEWRKFLHFFKWASDCLFIYLIAYLFIIYLFMYLFFTLPLYLI